MKEEGLRALILFSSVLLGHKGACRYLSNYRLMTRKQYLILPLTDEPVLIVPTLGQQLRAKEASWIKDVRAGGDTEGMVLQIAAVLKSAGVVSGTVGVVNLKTSLPFNDYRGLTETLPEVTFKDSTELLDAVRFLKSPEELEMMMETTEIADRSYDRLLEILTPGIDEREVMAEIDKLLGFEMAEDILILTAKGRSFPCFIGPPGAHIFSKGDHYVFSIELSGPSGYWSQIVRPVCLGEPSPSYERIFDVGKKALDKAAAGLIPGKRVSDIVRGVASDIEAAGYKTGLWCGHGMGTDLGDGIDLSIDNTLQIENGMTITLHPHVLSRDGREGLLLGDTFVVEEGGGRNLSRTTCELRSLP
jgi:Xaa-Pro aminopeptidase